MKSEMSYLINNIIQKIYEELSKCFMNWTMDVIYSKKSSKLTMMNHYNANQYLSTNHGEHRKINLKNLEEMENKLGDDIWYAFICVKEGARCNKWEFFFL